MTISAGNRTANLYYECTGDGPDVLLVHGFASSGRMWDRLVDELKDSFRFWVVDLPGFGEATLAEEDPGLSMPQHTIALADFCVQQDIRPKAVIGHSMGGMLTLKLALAYPDLIERLIIACPVVTGRFSVNILQLMSSDFGRLVIANSKLFWLTAQSDVLKALVPLALYADKTTATRVYNDFKRMNWQAAIGGLDSMAREDLGPHLEHIQHPTLVIVGARDYTVSPDEGRLAASTMRKGRLLEFPLSHHQPLDEEPERFVATVRTFLQEDMS